MSPFFQFIAQGFTLSLIGHTFPAAVLHLDTAACFSAVLALSGSEVISFSEQ
jgi:hypothetical protein